jgi:hypothetical protein
MRVRSRHFVTVAGALPVVAVIAIAATATGARDRQARASGALTTHRAVSVHPVALSAPRTVNHSRWHSRVSPLLIRSFSILRDRSARAAATSGSQALPAHFATRFMAGPGAKWALNPGLARYVAPGSNSLAQALWIIPGSRGACLVEEDPSGIGATCGPAGDVSENGLGLLVGTGPGNETSFELVPDGNSSVTVSDPGGGARQVGVLDNVVEVANAASTTVTYRTFSGQRAQHTVPMVNPPSN